MRNATNAYNPDYAVSPGLVLAERLEAHNITHADLAQRCGCSTKLIGEIISGESPVKPRIAIEFERILGVGAEIWLGIEEHYRLHLVKSVNQSARGDPL